MQTIDLRKKKVPSTLISMFMVLGQFALVSGSMFTILLLAVALQ